MANPEPNLRRTDRPWEEDRAFAPILATARVVLQVPAAFVAVRDNRTERIVTAGRPVPEQLAGLVGAAMRANEPVFAADLSPRYGIDGALLAVPFQAGRGVHGALAALDVRRREFSTHDALVLNHLAACVTAELDLTERATRDDLTGLLRRQPFMLALAGMVERFSSVGTPAVLSIFDLDHFKQVNDLYGHLMGDRVLRGLGETCRSVLAPSALVCRLGGEEFAVAFPGATLEEAVAPLVALRAALDRQRFSERPGLRVTASFGVCALHAALPNVSAWCKLADAALYGAKQAGRNQVRVGAAGAAQSAINALRLHEADDGTVLAAAV